MVLWRRPDESEVAIGLFGYGDKERPCIVWMDQKRKNNGGAKDQLISDSPIFLIISLQKLCRRIS
jgi:hypothetical protein